MKKFQNLVAIAVAGLLTACMMAFYVTRNAAPSKGAPVAPTPQTSLMDERLFETARRLAGLADTTDEQNLAREALRLTDHELDQAFATAVREAAAVVPPSSGPLKVLADRIMQLQSRIAADTARIAKSKETAAKMGSSDQLELANAQLALDQDELEDAQQDLARQGGDRRARLQQEVQEHEAIAQQAAPKFPQPPPVGTLREQVGAWFAL